MKHRSNAGDMLDEICWRHYGDESGYVEAVLEANYRLSHKPDVLPADVFIELPTLNIQKPIQRLWDDPT